MQFTKHLSPFLLVIFFSCISDKDPFESLNYDERVLRSRLYFEKAISYEYNQGCDIQWLYFDSSLLVNSKNDESWFEKSTWLVKIGDYYNQMKLLNKAVELNPESHLGYSGWIKLHYLRDYNGALKDLYKLDSLTPKFMDFPWSENIHYLKGLAYMQLEKMDLALDEFNRCVSGTLEDMDFESIDPYVFVYRGLVLEELGSLDLAKESYEKALITFPFCPEANFYLGRLLFENSEKTASYKHLEYARKYSKLGYLKTDPYKEVFFELSLNDIENYLNKRKINTLIN